MLTQEERELASVLPDELREQVESGELKVFPGQDPNKPVLRSSETGLIVKGSGITPKHVDMGQVSRDFAYKRRKNYRSALEEIVSAEGEGRGSFKWFVDKAMEAAEGSPTPVDCPKCNHHFVANVKKDGNVIVKMIEMLHGKAPITQDINIHDEAMLEILRSRTNRVEYYAITDEEKEQRKQALGLIDGEFTEAD